MSILKTRSENGDDKDENKDKDKDEDEDKDEDNTPPPPPALNPDDGDAPSGSLSMIGQEKISTPTFWLPSKYVGFRVHLTAVAMTPVFTITTNFLSSRPQYKVGGLGVFDGFVEISASNVYGWIDCQTSDSNGAWGGYAAVSNRF